MKHILVATFAFALLFLSSCNDPSDEGQVVIDPLDVGLVAHYTFDGNVNDVTLNKLHGVLHGPVLTKDRFGRVNSAYLFDGVDDYIDLSTHATHFNIVKPASFSFWIKTEYDNPQTVFSMCNKASADSIISGIYLGNGVTQWLNYELISVANVNTRQNYYITAFESWDRFWLIDDNWHHVVITYSDSLTNIYLDNHLLPLNTNKTNDGDFGIFSGVDYVTLGTRWASRNGAFLKGSLDDFRFYDRALTTEEVAELYY